MQRIEVTAIREHPEFVDQAAEPVPGMSPDG